jgi:hypothetical protein
MPRSVTFDQPNDTCMFTPLQLQPTWAYRFGMMTWARWLAEHIASFPSLVRDHGFGAVVIGAYAFYRKPAGFFDSDGIRVTGGVTVVKKRSLLRIDFGMFAMGGALDGERIADGLGVMRSLQLAGDPGLGATPIGVPPAIAAKFHPDEIDDAAPAPRPASELLARIEGAPAIAEGSHRVMCSRALSEVADQWSFVEAPHYSSHGREALVLSAGSRAPDLRRGLRQPAREVLTEYRKPAFAFDELEVRTRAVAHGDELVFVHAVNGANNGDQRAVIVERF